MKLFELFPQLTVGERKLLAERAQISPGYLWQLATRWKGKKPTVDLLARLAACEPRLSTGELVEEFGAPPTHPEPMREGA
jgi:hypothetical protein